MTQFKTLSTPLSNFLIRIVILFFFCAPVFLLSFQNCGIDNELESTSNSSTSEKSDDSDDSDDSYEYGYIVPLDSVSKDIIKDQIPLNKKISLKFEKAHPKSDNYKWSIQRGFELLETDEATETNIYQYTFSEAGAYDVFADSYEQETHKTKASKRLIVGDDCSLNDVLEIEVLPGSLTGDESSTQFRLRDDETFSSVNWKFTLPTSKDVIEKIGKTVLLDLSSESGVLIIEVITSHSERSHCLIHRKAEVPLNSIHFNPPLLTNGTNRIPWTLEWVLADNYIYKYQESTQHILQIDVIYADICEYQINQFDILPVNCNDGLIHIPAFCREIEITVYASNIKEKDVSEKYYNYCNQEHDYCYFGNRTTVHLMKDIPTCANLGKGEGSSFINGTCGTTKNSCNRGRLEDVEDTETHYKWQCAGENSGQTKDCQRQIILIPTTPIPRPTQRSCDNIQCESGQRCVDGYCVCPNGTYESKTLCEASHQNTTCALQNNSACYTWSCNEVSFLTNGKCQQCDFPSIEACNSGKPNGSTCNTTPDSRGCYIWSCSHGFTKAGNTCEQCGLAACNRKKPSASTCSTILDSRGCSTRRCNACYSGSSCEHYDPCCSVTCATDKRCVNGSCVLRRPPTTRPPTTRPPTTRPPTTRPPTTRPPTTRPPTTRPPTTRPPTTRPPTTRPPTTRPPTTRPPTTRPPDLCAINRVECQDDDTRCQPSTGNCVPR